MEANSRHTGAAEQSITERKGMPMRRPCKIAPAIALRMLDADMLGRGVAEDILTAAEVRHGHTMAMIAFEGAALG